jgi:hypothetical protein
MRRVFKVSIDIPANTDIEDCIDYISDAVSSWRGSLRPPCSLDNNDLGDPMWHLEPSTVKVTWPC